MENNITKIFQEFSDKKWKDSENPSAVTHILNFICLFVCRANRIRLRLLYKSERNLPVQFKSFPSANLTTVGKYT